MARQQFREDLYHRLNVINIEMPADWRQRVLIGSDRKQSSTARENLEYFASMYRNVDPANIDFVSYCWGAHSNTLDLHIPVLPMPDDGRVEQSSRRQVENVPETPPACDNPGTY